MLEHCREARDHPGIVEAWLTADAEEQVAPQHQVQHLLGGDAPQELGGLAGLLHQRVHRIEIRREGRELDRHGPTQMLVEVLSGLDRHLGLEPEIEVGSVADRLDLRRSTPTQAHPVALLEWLIVGADHFDATTDEEGTVGDR